MAYVINGQDLTMQLLSCNRLKQNEKHLEKYNSTILNNYKSIIQNFYGYNLNRGSNGLRYKAPIKFFSEAYILSLELI